MTDAIGVRPLFTNSSTSAGNSAEAKIDLVQDGMSDRLDGTLLGSHEVVVSVLKGAIAATPGRRKCNHRRIGTKGIEE